MRDLLLHGTLALVMTLALIWLLLIGVLLRHRSDSASTRDALRLAPDCVRLLRRLVVDRDVPRGVRVRTWLLIGYLACPIDLVPDFLPVIGYADDVVLVAIVLRSIARRSGVEALARNWPGTKDGFETLMKLVSVRS